MEQGALQAARCAGQSHRGDGAEDTVAIVEELVASPEDLAALALSLPAERRPFLLDSCGADAPDARLLIAGWDPFAALGGAGDPLDHLAAALARYRMPRAEGYPAGAAVGALAYDLGRRYERLPSTAPADAPWADASLALYDVLLIHDYAANRSLLVSTGLPEAGPRRARRAAGRAREARGMLGRARAPRGGGVAGRPVSNFDRDAYVAAVRRAQEYIAAGDIYQVNLTQRFTARLGDLGAPQLFWRLRERNPAAFAAYLAEPGRAVVSTSPERFLLVEGRRAEMCPIKGTRPRGATPEEDARLAAELAASEKDRAENLMIVDLIRNDLGRVAEYGSVRVDELFGVRALPTVFHMVSRVSGVLRQGAGGCDLLRAAFPCGSITGAPKIRAMEIIEEIEGVRRGVPMGAIGYASFDGRMDWNVAIRTLEIAGGVARFNVGGGVVADSDPAGEYEESLWKARAILDALQRQEGGGRRGEGA
jgi:para-aminobenzoate synthetase component 1